MGMFDCVEYEINCPVCGHKINDFQTKDCFRRLTNVKIENIPDKGSFYCSCHKCGLWVEFTKHQFDTEEEIAERFSALIKG